MAEQVRQKDITIALHCDFCSRLGCVGCAEKDNSEDTTIVMEIGDDEEC